MCTLAQPEFDRIAALALDRWGLHLTERKRDLVTNRLESFLRKNPQYGSTEAFIRHLQRGADEQDMLLFFDLLSTNVTSFFRERAAFDYLEREFYTPLDRSAITLPERKIRIWSAACSTGAEPYSIAVHAIEHLSNLSEWEFKILATDLAVSALKTAREGVYPAKTVEHLDKALVRRHFSRETHGQDAVVRISPQARRLVTIGRVNLIDSWPMKGPFDVIFLRNVMIYFDTPTRNRLVERMYNILRPGGIFVIGSAETLGGCTTDFRTVQPSIYVK